MNTNRNYTRNKVPVQDSEALLRAAEAPSRLISGAVVRELMDVLSGAIVSELAGVKNTRSIYQWLSGERQPEKLDSLRFALQIVYVMRAAGETDPTIAAWFTSVNPRLQDATPLALLSTSGVADVSVTVMNSVRAFLGLSPTEVA